MSIPMRCMINVERDGDHEVLELSVALPEKGRRGRRRKLISLAAARRHRCGAVENLLGHFALQLYLVGDEMPIPGSFWGDPEAGLIGSTVFARRDTPVHSLLHEACHLIVMPAERRDGIHTNATDSIAEEDAACYLQIVLADTLPDVGARPANG